MLEDLLQNAERRMKQAIETMAHDFAAYRTGRANPIVLERVHVNYYGTDTPISQIANISIPDPRQLVITPYDKSMFVAIEKAILRSDLGINPTNDGQNIRLVFPQMNEERRRELVKQVHSRAESACVAIRNVRRDAIEHARKSEKVDHLSEDDVKVFENKVQKLTDKYVAEAHDLQKKKDAELMEV
jgi:ribosome recycling factor